MSSTFANIEAFRRCVGVVLDILYASFPVPRDIDALYIEGRAGARNLLLTFDDEMRSWDEPGNSSEHNPIKNELIIYACSLTYLRDEGYITCGPIEHGKNQRMFSGCRLTSKGLAALGRQDIEEKRTFGGAIHDAVRNGKYQSLQDLVMKLLSLQM